jgi:hypothetical protein
LPKSLIRKSVGKNKQEASINNVNSAIDYAKLQKRMKQMEKELKATND